MTEDLPDKEGDSERILNDREVLNALEDIAGSEYEIVRREEDETGLKILEIVTRDDNGEIVKFNYTRDDNEGETVIDVVYFEGEAPVGGNPIKKYRKGVWSD